jgi:amino-acid N-acetyltransferase
MPVLTHAKGRRAQGRGLRASRGRITLRTGESADAKKLFALIQANLEEGHLLPRTLHELTTRANQFVVAVKGRKIVGCAELAPLSPHVAEVRSLAVDDSARGSRVGVAIVDELRRRARRDGFEKLCAFTHAPGYFIHMGFSIVPHLWLTEKVFIDCVKCPQFRQCGQYAMVVPLDVAFDAERGYGLPGAAAAPVA